MTLNDPPSSDLAARLSSLEQRLDGVTRLFIVLLLLAAIWMCGLTYVAIHHAPKASAKGNRNAPARADRPSKSKPAKSEAQ